MSKLTPGLAFSVLGLHLNADVYTVLDVDARWRVLRSELHPDKPSGDAAKFHEAKQAYDVARQYALEPKPCKSCHGTGKREVPGSHGRFTAPLEMVCATCKGSRQR
jgi:DnaJ-class molecular chaperone